MQAGAIVAVWRTIAREHEWEVHEFYEQEHMEHVVEIDGFLAGYRYYNVAGALPFLILYEAVDESTEAGPGFQKLVKEPGPRAVRVGKLPGTKTRRVNYAVRQDTGSRGSPGGLLALHSDGGPGAAAAPAGLRDAIPGCLRYRALQAVAGATEWLELWDFESLAAAQAALPRVPARGGAAIETYEAVGIPWIKDERGVLRAVPLRSGGT